MNDDEDDAEYLRKLLAATIRRARGLGLCVRVAPETFATRGDPTWTLCAPDGTALVELQPARRAVRDLVSPAKCIITDGHGDILAGLRLARASLDRRQSSHAPRR